MKRKLRKEIKWLLTGLVLSQALTLSLNAYNNHLERKLEYLELKVQDYKVEQQMSLKSNEIEPCSTSSVKTYMDYRAITSKTSDQYIYIQDHMHIKDGYLLDEDGYIGVALGSWFGEIGSKWVITLDTGIEMYVVKIEEKADEHTGSLNCEHLIDHSVIEFVIDTDYFQVSDNGYIYAGNFNNNEWWNGNIESVRKVE